MNHELNFITPKMSVFDELERLISAQKPNTDPSQFFASLGSPSVSIAVLDHGEITTQCYSTIGHNVKTRFQACSISKPVSAMAVMKLVEQGRLSLEDKIAPLLPEIIVEHLGPAALVQDITISHILSHTAGLTAWGFPGYVAADHPSPIDVILGTHGVNTTPVKLAGIPGRQWRYSGGGFILLQIAMEKVTSLSFPELMADLVLRPLEMHDSCYGVPEHGTDLAEAYLTGITPSPAQWHYLPEQATAGLWTTPADLLKVIHALQKSFAGGENTFLQKETAKLMLTEINSNQMSLGWVAPKNPGTWFGHTGSNDPGYRCTAMGTADLLGQKNEAFSNAECGIAVMTNSGLGVLPMFTALQTIKFLRGWREAATAQTDMQFVAPLSLPDRKVRGEWREWQGRWSSEYDEWTIDADGDGQPQARWRQTRPVRLLPAAICSEIFQEGESLDLVLDGVGSILRLAWRDGARSIDYMDPLTYKTTKLSRPRSKSLSLDKE